MEDDIAVPVQFEPRQAIDNGIDRGGRGTFAVGILDPQKDCSAMPACVQPIEKRRPATTIWRKPVGDGANRVTMSLAMSR